MNAATPPAADTARRPGVGSAGREDILAAAADSFMEFGYQAATIDDVADRVGATKGRVYHYYRSKADLFLDVHIAAMAIMLREVAPLAAATDAPPAVRLRRMAVRHAEVVMENFPFQKVSIQGLEKPLISDRASRHGQMLDKVVGMRDAYEALFVEVLAQGIATGDFVDQPPRMLTKPILGALNWLTIWYNPARAPDGGARQAIACQLADFVVRGARRPG